VQVAGGGVEVGMPEQFLHGADVRTALDELGGEGVPEPMQCHLAQAGAPKQALDLAMELLAREGNTGGGE